MLFRSSLLLALCCLLLAACSLLLAACCSVLLTADCCLLLAACRLLLAASRLLLAACCSLFAARCSLLAACCLLLAACGLPLAARWSNLSPTPAHPVDTKWGPESVTRFGATGGCKGPDSRDPRTQSPKNGPKCCPTFRTSLQCPPSWESQSAIRRCQG